MNPYWLLFIIPMSFIGGFFLATILASSGMADVEDMWRQQLMNERDSHKGTQKMLDEYRLRERGVI